jgi:predicted acetyltransferase
VLISTGIELIYASEKYKEVIKNLMQLYIYDFSEYVNYDVGENGLFSAYPDLLDYWKGAGDKFPYVIKKEGKYVGFVLVKRIKSEKEQFSIAEFFVMKKYREQGIGKAVAGHLFRLYKGWWEVHQRENNQAAQQFWIKVISDYTNGEFSDYFKNERRIQHFRS